MRSRVHRQQPLLAYMSVDLRGLQAGVTQEFLHHTQVGPPVQQVGGEAVTEGVGVGRDRRPAVEEAPHVPRAEPVAPAVEEKGPRPGTPPGHGGPGPASQARDAAAQRSWIRTWRCLDPFPVTVTTLRSRSTSATSSPQSSATRIPPP